MKPLLQRPDDWVVVLILWGLSFELGWQLPALGGWMALILSLLLLARAGWNLWMEIGVNLDDHASFRGWVQVILTGLVFTWLIPGLTVGHWLPWLASLMSHLA